MKLDEPVESSGVELTEAVTTVAWTAQKGAALPAQFTGFEISPGLFPEHVKSMSFPTVQTHSDGEVARRTQPVRDGATEPEHPAPTVEIAPTTATEAVNPAAATSRSSASSETAGGGT